MIETTDAAKQMRKAVEAILDWLVAYKFILEVATYALGAIALLIGGLTLLASREDGRRQEMTILGLQKGIVDAQRELAAEQMRRAELIESVLWRNGLIDLGEWVLEYRKSLREAGIPFKKVNVSIVCAKKREPMWVANDLAMTLSAGDFHVTDLSFTNKPMRPGIFVERRAGTVNPGDFRYKAADAVVAALRHNFVTAKTFPADLPDNTLRVVVGPSDRLPGPKTWQRITSKGAEPPNELPPPLIITDENGSKDVATVTFPDPGEPDEAHADVGGDAE